MTERIKIKASIHKRNVADTWNQVAKEGIIEIDHRDRPNMVILTVEHHEALLTQAKIGEVECDDDGWIDWSGGDNPASGKMVNTIMLGYEDSPDEHDVESDRLRWTCNGFHGDIIRYRVIEGAKS